MKSKNRKVLALILLSVWLVTALACNFPYFKSEYDSRAHQQTLVATLFPDQTTPQVPTGSPENSPSQPQVLSTSGPVGAQFDYAAQSGDTLPALALRFGVAASEIRSNRSIPAEGLIPIGQHLSIPNKLLDPNTSTAAQLLLPDSEIVYSPAAADFDVDAYIAQAEGFLAGYSEDVDQQHLSGAQIVKRVALEMSIDPRLLLAVLDYRSHWVHGQPADPNRTDQPIGFGVPEYRGLYKELVLTGRQLTIGYYGWRTGSVTELKFVDGSSLRLDPRLNAGSVSLSYLFSVLYNRQDWQKLLYQPDGFLTTYQNGFGDAWARAAAIGPLIPDNLQQPILELPFTSGEAWSFTGGPHMAWGVGSTRGGIDFAPIKNAKGCVPSQAWVTAAAPGLVTRSGDGIVLTDLDMDGKEQTGWSLMYLHIAGDGRVTAGTYLQTNQPVGHPSCEGGVATGTHVHLARKYNGEWISAGAPVPFVLSGWQALLGSKAYLGSLVKGDQIVTAKIDGSHGSTIYR
jgi:murein DD-endopeptidase MepM/ murein hydrolase activator NlpD